MPSTDRPDLDHYDAYQRHLDFLQTLADTLNPETMMRDEEWQREYRIRLAGLLEYHLEVIDTNVRALTPNIKKRPREKP